MIHVCYYEVTTHKCCSACTMKQTYPMIHMYHVLNLWKSNCSTCTMKQTDSMIYVYYVLSLWKLQHCYTIYTRQCVGTSVSIVSLNTHRDLLIIIPERNKTTVRVSNTACITTKGKESVLPLCGCLSFISEILAIVHDPCTKSYFDYPAELCWYNKDSHR